MKKRSIHEDITRIVKIVSDETGIPVEQMHKETRKREIVEARQIAMYLCKLYTKRSLSDIGYNIGGKDHATVLHAAKTVRNISDTDMEFKKKIDDIESYIKNGLKRTLHVNHGMAIHIISNRLKDLLISGTITPYDIMIYGEKLIRK